MKTKSNKLKFEKKPYFFTANEPFNIIGNLRNLLLKSENKFEERAWNAKLPKLNENEKQAIEKKFLNKNKFSKCDCGKTIIEVSYVVSDAVILDVVFIYDICDFDNLFENWGFLIQRFIFQEHNIQIINCVDELSIFNCLYHVPNILIKNNIIKWRKNG